MSNFILSLSLSHILCVCECDRHRPYPTLCPFSNQHKAPSSPPQNPTCTNPHLLCSLHLLQNGFFKLHCSNPEPPNPEGPSFSDFGITDSGEFYAKNNPFQRSGPVGATERIAMAKNDKVIYVRVDMPGVPKECLYLTTFPDNVVFCGGLAPVVCEGDRGRLYGASYGLRSHKLRKPQVNISNGVATVKMKVSKKSKTGTRCSNSPSWDEELKKDELSFYLVTHPSETEGPKETYGAKKVKEGFYVWVDMPGATKEKVSVGVEDGFVVFSGEAVNESNDEESGRTYKGRFGPFDVTKIGEIKTDVRNGVLRMLIPEKADE